ncbi:MAG: hypothetical protein ABS70_00090 [Nitrospira sp. SCN 59-13]|nr:MAG: hypothetical protein ABS70_00090 [Nitrospira sp. SCN 59-13]
MRLHRYRGHDGPWLSVVVPTYRRPDLLQRCLSTLCDQTMEKWRYEIIVVVDGGSEDIRQLITMMTASPGGPVIQYLATPARRGPASARNLGWRSARGGIIAFTDDDCIATPTWLESGWAAIRSTGLSGVWGRIIVPIPENPTDHELCTKGLEQAPCATANCFYRKDALEEVGGFDERFTRAWREDSDLQFMLLERHHRLAPCEGAVIVHPARRAAWGISVALQRNNEFNALLYKKHPDLYRTLLHASAPWNYYVGVAAMLLALGSLLAHWPAGIVLGMAVWLALTAHFCWHRLRVTSKHWAHVCEMVVTSALIPPVAVYWRLKGAWRYRVLFV